MLQLKPTIPMLTPKGPALAHFVIDYGEEHHLMWVCILSNTGEIWTFSNPDVRGQTNLTMNRGAVDVPYDGDDNERQC